ncbi:MAG: hypothetical protein AAGA56_23535, partial [Myxococcota bacterium]
LIDARPIDAPDTWAKAEEGGESDVLLRTAMITSLICWPRECAKVPSPNATRRGLHPQRRMARSCSELMVSRLAPPLLLAGLLACDTSPSPVQAEPAEALIVPVDPPTDADAIPSATLASDEATCTDLSPRITPVRLHVAQSVSLDELIESLEPILGGCIDVRPSLLHRYRCLEVTLDLDAPSSRAALEQLKPRLVQIGLSLGPRGGRFALERAAEGDNPCPDIARAAL